MKLLGRGEGRGLELVCDRPTLALGSVLVHQTKQLLRSADRGLPGGFLLCRNFSVAISVSPHACFILVLILISMLLR